jgi:hypothetical protein
MKSEDMVYFVYLARFVHLVRLKSESESPDLRVSQSLMLF